MVKSFICGIEGTNLTNGERDFLEREQPYGVILFARNVMNPAQLRALITSIKQALGHPFANVLVDQEGGRVARLRPPHWRAYPPALDLAKRADAERAIYVNARMIAEELRWVGFTTDCAPMADVLAPECHDIIGDRAFGDTPDMVAKLARAQARGLMDGGILPVLKHIPGHGRATCDSHEALPVVKASMQELEASDFQPFRALKDIPLGMTAHIIYEALDAKRCATVSPTVINFIRTDIKFDGLLMSDDLSMKALTGSYELRTELTLAAGCDLALHCNGKMDEMKAIASKAGPLVGEALRRAENALSALPPHLPADDESILAEWQRFLAVA